MGAFCEYKFRFIVFLIYRSSVWNIIGLYNGFRMYLSVWKSSHRLRISNHAYIVVSVDRWFQNLNIMPHEPYKSHFRKQSRKTGVQWIMQIQFTRLWHMDNEGGWRYTPFLYGNHYNSMDIVIYDEESELPGPRFNTKTVLSTYGDFHVKDKTAVRTSYL